jgi:hypothetical protein
MNSSFNQSLEIARQLDNLKTLTAELASFLVSQHFPNEETAINRLVLGHLDMANFHMTTAKEMLSIQKISILDSSKLTDKPVAN